MATVTIKTPDDGTAFAAGASVKLTAQSDAQASAYQWWLKDRLLDGAVNNQYEFVLGDDTVGKYVVEAFVAGERFTSAPVTITQADTTKPEPTPTQPSEPPPVFHSDFAIVAGVAVLGLGVVLAINAGLLNRFGIAAEDWKALDSGLKVGVSMAVPVSILGALLILVGLWMALVEWRGRFVEHETSVVEKKGLPDLINEKTIEALGKLKGPALVMLVGAVLLLSSSWVAQAAAGGQEPTPTASATPTP